MAALAYSYTAVTGNTITAARWNTMNTETVNSVNSISNAQIASDAAISYSKLSLTGAILNADISASAAIAYSKLSLTGEIVNADISATAAIAASKISDTAVTLTATQTLTNKTLTTPVVTGGYDAWVSATDGATITFNLASGNKQRVTLGGNRTLALSNVQNGHVFFLRLLQDGTGSRTVTWFSTIKWAGGTAPTLTTTANKADTFAFMQTASDEYDGFICGQNI